MGRKLFLALLLGVIFFSTLKAQSNQSLIKEDAPRIFIDCGYCDMNYIKEQIPIVNYVRDRNDADVHVLYTSQSTAAGGKDYILYFIGQNKFQNVNDTIKYQINQTDTDDLARGKMVNALKFGLVRYVARFKASDYMKISFNMPIQKEETPVDDWNYWFFTASARSSFSGEQNHKYLYLNTSLSANRVTEDLKLSFKVNSNYNENKFTFDDGVTKQDILSASRNQNFTAYMVKAINPQWSWGAWVGGSSSTYSNIEFSTYIAPGIEYNIFPYSVSNEKQLRIDYRLRHTFTNYSEETIFFKKKDNLWSHSLEANLTLIKPWGSVSIGSEAGNYLHDFNLYELSIDGSLSLKLLKGLSVSLYGGYSKINNQLSLRREGASLEEVLTQRRQLETSYNYWGGFGISFSFGSIYNNIVNPRFGSINGSGMTIMISN